MASQRGNRAETEEPYRLVREAAEGAKEALETTEFYHQDRVALETAVIGVKWSIQYT